jgi:hypothetical protein
MEFRRKAKILSFQKVEVVETCRNTVLVQALYIAGRKTTAKEDGLK